MLHTALPHPPHPHTHPFFLKNNFATLINLAKERCGFGGLAAEKSGNERPGAIKSGDDALTKGEPVNPRVVLVGGDTIKTPGENKSAEDVTLLLLELDVADGGGTQEDNANDGKNDMEHIRAIIFHGGEGGKDGEGGSINDPTVPEAKGGVHKELGGPVGGGVVGLEVVENERDGGRSEEDGDQAQYEMALVPKDDPSCVEKRRDSKVPANTMDDTRFRGVKPLSNDKSPEEDVNCRPNIMDPWSWSEVCQMLFERFLVRSRAKDRVHC